VKLPDLNLLIYAVDSNSPQHRAALRWWNRLLSGTETVALAWTVLLGFLRLTTSPSVMRRPLSTDEALGYLDRWIAHPLTVIVDPTPNHAAILRDLLEELGTAGNLVTDAHLAALALEHGAELQTADSDFGRFRRLRWVDPLARAG
jgi:hypothetical protein